MNRSIRHKNLDTAVSTILNQNEEKKCWSLYLACVANPFSEYQSQSFEEFMSKLKAPAARNISREVELGLNKVQMQKQVNNAAKVLSEFVPPMKGG